MIVDVGAPYRERVAQAVGDENLRTALDRATARLAERRAAGLAAVDSDRMRREAHAVRRYATEHLPDLLEALEANLIANGCRVHWARNAAEAGEIVRGIAAARDVKRVVKSKSMATEEIHLNEFLEQAGIAVRETDLGEYIIQLAGEPPSHIIAPVIHKRVEEIGELFHRELGIPRSTDPATLCAAARSALRDEFLAADMGISGGNFAIAESGTICIITNEGNGRMVTSMPPVYVAVVGIEKVVPRVEDAVLLWQAAARNATGQAASVYFSMSSGPRRPGHPDGPEEMHVVLVDNGRARVMERGYGDALWCIRCSACLNVCPVYREIGGHAYGRTAYNGPIGAVLTPLLADDPASVCELPYASTLCGACRDVCPAMIDLPQLLLDLRADMVRSGASSVTERVGMRAFAKTVTSPRRYRAATTLARWATRLLARGRPELHKLPFPFSAWTASRRFPVFAARRLRDARRDAVANSERRT